MTKTQTPHPFGELLTQYRQRKPGLTQTRLAEMAGYDQAILVRMGQGKKDLTGPSGRERAVRLIETLADQGGLTLLDEANALLLAADMSPLFERQPSEARLIERLSRSQPGHRLRRTNLPAPLTSFVGRAQEIAEVRRLLNTARLLTLIGAGGSGKTRLAQCVAADVLLHYSDGVWYVEFASLTDPSLIADMVARVFGLHTEGRTAQEAVATYLQERQLLLVLDNCEHLIEAVAEFTFAVLRTCSRVTILATSREGLNVEGEALWRVPPMQPDEAGQLFVERATASRSDIPLSTHDETVAHICQRLDGMPLAIELAAARLQTLGLSDIAARLDDRFSLLAGGRRGALPRHQTLRALIDWSYDALSEPEKVAFRRLGVFVGGWELEQAEQVLILEPDTESLDMISIQSQLIAKSLVSIYSNAGGHSRFYFLETLREYAKEKLLESGEMPAMRRRHAEIFALQIGISTSIIDGPDQKERLDRIQRDHENLEAALEWSFSGGSTLMGCCLVSGLVCFWAMRTRFKRQASHWTQVAKQSLSDQTPLLVQAGVWMAVTMFLSTNESVIDDAQMVVHLYQLAGDEEGIAHGKFRLAQCLFWSNRKVEGLLLLEEGVALARNIGELGEWLVRLNIYCLGTFADNDGNLERAECYYEEALHQYQAVSDLSGTGETLLALSSLAVERFEFDAALRLADQALVVSQELEDVSMEISSRLRIAEVLRLLRKFDKSEEVVLEALQISRDYSGEYQLAWASVIAARTALSQDRSNEAYSLVSNALKLLARRYGIQNDCGSVAMEVLIWHAGQLLQWKRYAHLFGIRAKLRSGFPSRRPNPMDLDIGTYIAKARTALGDEAYKAAYTEGRAMPFEIAIEYALAA